MIGFCRPLPTILSALVVIGALQLFAQEPPAAGRGSLIEDRAARKLLDAGDARMDADEPDKALEIWGSIIERYPRSRHRFDAHLRLGDYLLESERKFDKARIQFESVAAESNPDREQRAQAALKLGVCFFEGRQYGKAFATFRDLIEEFPTSEYLNRAYYYIGLGHFRLGHYSRAIESLEKVGTALGSGDSRQEAVEAGRRLYLKIEDLDLSILEPGETVSVTCSAASGDTEVVSCLPLGRSIHLVLGSIPTELGSPDPGNGVLEVLGGDTITAVYSDLHTADRSTNEKRKAVATVVGTGVPRIMDGSFESPVDGVVIGKSANLQITDPDRDRTSGADRLRTTVDFLRLKTEAEIEEEMAEVVASTGALPATETDAHAELKDSIDRFRVIGSIEVEFLESGKVGEESAAIHSGVFRARLPIGSQAESNSGNGSIRPLPGDRIRIVYTDELNLSGEPVERVAEASCIVGDLGDVRITRTEISDRELHLKTRLRTANALTRIGNHYKEFGLGDRASIKYAEALEACTDIEAEARAIGGTVLEETYVQLWRTYFAMEQLDRALAMSQQLIREFPDSSYVDEAMLQQAHVVRENGELSRAIGLYSVVVKLRESALRGEAQFGIAECYEELALAAPATQAEPLFDRAFTEYQKIYEQYPDSGRIGEAVSKMASFFYQKQDYARAIDVFEIVFDEHPDAVFLDVILFNYGRCLYRLERKAEARRKFDQLIAEYPESKLAGEAKRISDVLAKTGF